MPMLFKVAALFLLCGYVAWCGRVFFLKPEIRYRSGVPPLERLFMEQWYAETDDPAALEFTLRNLGKALLSPGDTMGLYGYRPVAEVETGPDGRTQWLRLEYGGRVALFQRDGLAARVRRSPQGIWRQR